MSLECTYCKGELKNGHVSIHGTFGGFMLFGLSHQNLYFKSDSGKEIKILGSTISTPALRCENCGVVILNKTIDSQRPREILNEILTVTASKELQESIMKANPEANIQDEIEKMWVDFYSPQATEFKESFTSDELVFLSEFNDLIASKNWKEIEAVADAKIDSIVVN